MIVAPKFDRPESGARPLILGVDPGVKGALAWYDIETKRVRAIIDMPVTSRKLKSGRMKNTVNPFDLSATIDAFSKETRFAVVEEVGSRPNQSAQSTFSLGFSAGQISGAIFSHYIPIYYVKPAVWKSLMGLSYDKKKSLEKARQLFPDKVHMFTMAKDDGRAEAALLASFGVRFISSLKTKSSTGNFG